MKKHLSALLLALGIAGCVHAQPYVPGFTPLQQIPCPFDPAQTVTQPVGWVIYQTTDGHWDGSVDSSRCISATAVPPGSGVGIEIALAQINLAYPLFLRARLDLFPSAVGFDPDYLYDFYLNSLGFPANIPVRTTTDCPDDLCTGAIWGIAIPDENGQPGAATRFHTALADTYTPPANFTEIGAEACFPTERFADQVLQEFVLKYTFPDTATLSGMRLQVRYTGFTPNLFGPSGIGYVTAVPAVSNPVNVQYVGGGWGIHFLGLYTAPTYPGPQNPSYIEAFPVPNTTIPQNITLTVDAWQVLEMQPFAQFRGGLVAGSTTDRHGFTLLNNGGDLCLNFVDLIFDNGDALHHAGGQIGIHNAFSCMQFKNGSELRVQEGATLHYGHQGAGMLVICANSTIALERNATLILDAILQISECDDDLPPHDIFMDLPPGARLVFTENAWLTNRFSKNQQMRLNVRMLGGTLDDTALPADARALIRRIYPDPAPNWADNVQVSPNPFADNLTVQYLAGADEPLLLRWIDVQGGLVREEALPATKGINTLIPQVPAENGLYFLEISTPTGGKVVRKVVRN